MYDSQMPLVNTFTLVIHGINNNNISNILIIILRNNFTESKFPRFCENLVNISLENSQKGRKKRRGKNAKSEHTEYPLK